jgi:hypothetical protein
VIENPATGQAATLQKGTTGPWSTDTVTLQMLASWGVPATPTTEEAMYFWIKAEGGVPHNNPLNVSTAYPGAVTQIAQIGSSSPIYSYASLDDGIAADVSNLNTATYSGVKAAFSNPNASLLSIWSAINQSPWCKGCTKGTYPGALFSALGPGASTVAASGAATAATGTGASSASSTPACVISSPLGGCLFNAAQAQELVGGLLMLGGGLILFVGLGLVAASMGSGRTLRVAEALPGPAGTTARVAGGQGRQVGAERRTRATRAQAQSDALERIDARGGQSRRSSVRYDEKPF